jgi:hypothetical protein
MKGIIFLGISLPDNNTRVTHHVLLDELPFKNSSQFKTLAAVAMKCMMPYKLIVPNTIVCVGLSPKDVNTIIAYYSLIQGFNCFSI